MSKVLLVYEDYTEMSNVSSVLKKVGFDVVGVSSEFSLSEQVLSFNPDIVVGYGKGSKVSTIGVGRRLKEMPRWSGKSVLVFPAGVKPDPADLARSRMDMALEGPLEMNRLLQVLANLTKQDPQALIEKMANAVAIDAQNQTRVNQANQAAKNEAPLFVTGSKEAEEKWDVKGGQEIEEFNRMMGFAAPETAATTVKERGGPQFPLAPASLREQLENAAAHLSDKVAGYAKFLQDVIPGGGGLKRTEMRKAQKELRKDWSDEQLKSQDQLRRQFAEALFKKKD